MGRQGLGGAGAAGRSMQRSQSRSSLSASFEALAGYFPCMNSLEEEEGGEAVCGWRLCPFTRRSLVGERFAGEGEPPVAGSLPRSALGDCARASDPRARRPSRQVPSVGYSESSRGADLRNGFPSEVHDQVLASSARM